MNLVERARKLARAIAGGKHFAKPKKLPVTVLSGYLGAGLASRPDFTGVWSQAGRTCHYQPADRWWVTVPRAEWPQEYHTHLKKTWAEPYGDRRNELVLIGQKMDRAQLTGMFDFALLTDDEEALGMAAWTDFDDPFPKWAFKQPAPEAALVA